MTAVQYPVSITDHSAKRVFAPVFIILSIINIALIARLTITLFLCLTGTALFAQEPAPADYAHAREEALAGRYAHAEKELLSLLEVYPQDLDARVLLGRVYAWQERYDAAITQLEQVLSADPEHQDGRNALLDALLWSKRYEQALPVVAQGLEDYPVFADFHYKQAWAQYETGQEEAAAQTLAQLFFLNPAHEAGLALQARMGLEHYRNTLTAAAGVMLFSELFDPASYAMLEGMRQHNWGKSLLRLNMNSRFGEQGWQGEIDLYPVIKDGLYGYLNYGYSGSFLFPEHRAGAEVFARVSAKAEGSLGLRWLSFDPANEVLLYTGSLSLYHRQMWYSLRPFVTSHERAGTGVSVGLQARRYFGNPLNFIELGVNVGYSPDFRIIQAGNGLSSEELFALQSQRIGLIVQKSLSQRWFIGFEGSLTHQEVQIADTDYLWITNLLARASFRF